METLPACCNGSLPAVVFLFWQRLQKGSGAIGCSRFAVIFYGLQKTSYYIINSITLYRLIASLALFYFILADDFQAFRWMLVISFFTDAIDGYLARRFGVTSIMGSRIDSVADDLTVLMAVIGLLVWELGFIVQEFTFILVLFAVYLVQLISALVKYGRITSFHTYLAKLAAVLQGIFLILVFFLPEWPLTLFYVTAVVTIVELVEEIILVWLLPRWQSDVKGLYWALKKMPFLHQ